jgi:phosphate starvation-inducible PhoH-like protein
MQQYAEYDAPTPKPQVIQRLEPKNNNQRKAIEYLTAGKSVVFLTGSAGTGKSMIAAWHAATQLRGKAVKKVFLVRPAVSVGKSIGLLPGEIDEKLGPYFAQTLSHLQTFLGAGYLTYCREKKVIEMKPVEYLRGMSFEDCIVIAEEVQNFTAEEMEMMLTRLGQNCTIIFTGDTKQHDLRGDSGLDVTLKLLDRILQTHPEYMEHEDMDELDDGIGVVRFKPEDVVRSGLTRAFVKLYYHNT